MSNNSTSDIAGPFKKAMRNAARAATTPLVLPDHDLLVRYGAPSMAQLKAFDEVIAVGKVTAGLDFAAMGTNRQRELVLTADVLVSVFRSGGDDEIDGDDLEEEVGDRAYELLNAIEEYCRVTDTTLEQASGVAGGLVRHCFCTGHESDGMTDPEAQKLGRAAFITATFTAPTRISK